MTTLDEIRQQGANKYWDDVPFSENPYICGHGAKEGYEKEFQAWADGWNQSDRQIMHGVKNEQVG